MSDHYHRNVYKPNDFTEDKLPRRRRSFEAPKKSWQWKNKLPQNKKIWILGALFALYFLSRIILGPLQSFFWQIPGIIGLPFHDNNYVVVVFDDKESFGSTGKTLWLGEIQFSKGLYGGVEPLKMADPLPAGELDPVRQALFGTENYALSFFNFDLSLKTNYQELQKFYPDKNWDGLIFVNESILEKPEDLSKKIAWSFYNPFFWPFEFRAFAKNLDEQKILIYSENESTQNKLEKKNWSGQNSFEHDYFLGGLYGFTPNFPTELIHKDLRYYIQFLDEKDANGNNKVQAEIRVSFENNSKTQDFQGYWRWIIPKENRILSKINIQEKYPHALGIGEKISLESGARKEYIYRYELNSSIWDETSYHWDYLAQGAWRQDHLRFVAYAPSSMNIESSDLSIHEDLAYKILNLDENHRLSIQLSPDTKTPEWLGVKILSPNKIEILFSEIMGPSAEDPSRYRLSHGAVLSATKDETKVILDIEDMGTSEKEIQILIKGLRDLNGNPLEPLEPSVSFQWSQEWIDLFTKPVQDTEANTTTPTEFSQTSL